MRNQFKLSFRPIVLIVIFTCLFISCSDSNTGVNPEIPPNIPQLDKIAMTPNWDYFNIDSSVQPESNFQKAKKVTQRLGKIIDVSKNFYEAYLKPAISKEPVFKNSKWIWIYRSKNSGSSQTQLKLTANENGNIIWQLFYPNVDIKGSDQTILNGSTITRRNANNKSNSGHWLFHTSTDSTLVINYHFKSLNNKYVAIHKYSDGSPTISGNYQVNPPNHKINTHNFGKNYYEVYWNTKAGTGYVVIAEKKMCWDANYQNIEC